MPDPHLDPSPSPDADTDPIAAIHALRRDEFTPAGYDCPHCGRSSSGSLLASRRICTWHGPEGETCRAPATSGELCAKHRALVEMLREPLRPAE